MSKANYSKETNSVEPDQIATRIAVRSGSKLFATKTFKMDTNTKGRLLLCQFLISSYRYPYLTALRNGMDDIHGKCI